MTFERFKKLNNLLFYGAVLYTVGVLIKNYYDSAHLPEGVCPIENNNHLMIIGIVLLLLSFIGNVYITYRTKKDKKKALEQETKGQE